MSGAGKSSALKMLEDIGYYCIDNLLVPLMPKLADLLKNPNSQIDKIALGIDIRSGENFIEVDEMLKSWKKEGLIFDVLFLECDDNMLIRRFKETRRIHPLSNGQRVENLLTEERKLLQGVKSQATYILDTTELLIRELKSEITRIFLNNQEYKNLYITILSFGFKNGIPRDADLVFDVRFLPNPYYISELKKLSGNDAAVHDFVMKNKTAQEFLEKLTSMIRFLCPNYTMEGKSNLIIAIGCTGGKHRSVTIANELYNSLKALEEYGLKVEHRDIQRENKIKGL